MKNMINYCIIANDKFNKRKVFEYGYSSALNQCRWLDLRMSFKNNIEELSDKSDYLQPVEITIIMAFVDNNDHNVFNELTFTANGVAIEIAVDLFKAHINGYQTFFNELFES